jgi:UDP-N-acetylglucosamine diphosphorylase / glucose-1-phosphate thymidylyltransferase / UDP-N-acetylgalactosamine diphosphorylase / glucosamine-1-phosphate N-acetyltransferase / galactosamine-1-phosphate N-acetyltransferase
MPTKICLFEDSKYSQLLPLAYFRPVYFLKCGARTLKEKVEAAYPRLPVDLHCRKYLAEVVRMQNPQSRVNELTAKQYLFINGRAIVDEKFAKAVHAEGAGDTVYVQEGQVVAARLSGENLRRIAVKIPEVYSLSDFDGISKKELRATLVQYPFELVKQNGMQLRADFSAVARRLKGRKIRGKVSPGVSLINKKDIFIGEGSVVKPGVVIDAGQGPVFIAKNVTVMPHSTIIGPAYIGNGSIIKVGAKVYEDTSIGASCKVGGEVEASIIDGYSNKQHDGFLGHSYLGAWVNLGAGTTNSDLKNNYGVVKVTIDGKVIDSGEQFVGVTVGDHTKTAINTLFNTGTVVGVVSNIVANGFPPKSVPSFAWGGDGGIFTAYDVERAIETARKVMARRNVVLSDAEAALFRTVFDLTADERGKSGSKR